MSIWGISLWKTGPGQGRGRGGLTYCWAGSWRGANEVPWGHSPCPFLKGPLLLGRPSPTGRWVGRLRVPLGAGPGRHQGLASEARVSHLSQGAGWGGGAGTVAPSTPQIPDPNEFLQERHTDPFLSSVSQEQVPGLRPPCGRSCGGPAGTHVCPWNAVSTSEHWPRSQGAAGTREGARGRRWCVLLADAHPQRVTEPLLGPGDTLRSEDFQRRLVPGAGPQPCSGRGGGGAPAWGDPVSLVFLMRTCRGQMARLSRCSDPQRGWWSPCLSES